VHPRIANKGELSRRKRERVDIARRNNNMPYLASRGAIRHDIGLSVSN